MTGRKDATTAGAALLVAAVVGLAVAPGLEPGVQDLGTTLLVYLTVAQAWNILAGFAGQVSLGAAAFVATGAYTAGLALAHTSIGWAAAVALAGAIAGLIAAMLAVPLLRLRGDYFTIGTLAASIAVQALLTNWNWAGGASGLTLPIDRIPAGTTLLRLAVVVAAAAMGLTAYVRYSAFGLRLGALRDNEPAAAGLGVAVYGHRFATWVGSSVLTGMAGAVVAYQYVAVSPSGVASVNWSLDAVLMALVGGAGSLIGPVLGTTIVYYGLTRMLEDFQVLSLLVEGTLLVLIVRFAPAGVLALLTRAARPLRRAATLPAAGTEPA
ncbi:branched-chain amino acid ABC transporter permease [Actinoplanes subtropicus]|uniref:branched-chain amino acid ABC transporter permease n=1 Tax=Actinoplanes subtropicus TaxID=543632 RepID=UPI0004C44C88|nr:branched-chain amino acid ABC transporter permease [Actinoplanes subtropicus]